MRPSERKLSNPCLKPTLTPPLSYGVSTADAEGWMKKQPLTACCNRNTLLE